MPAAFLKCLLPSCVPAAFLDFNDIWDCYWWDICNIRYIYGLYMNKIFPIISLIWFRNGFSKVQRGCNDIKIVYISNFSQFRSRGGVIENQFFPKFKKVQIILGEGGVKKIMDFFHKLWYFLFWTVPLAIRKRMKLKYLAIRKPMKLKYLCQDKSREATLAHYQYQA